MTSPVAELSQSLSPSAETAAYPSDRSVEETAAFGPDEEQLVERARSEALLRLARAL